jgi:integrase
LYKYENNPLVERWLRAVAFSHSNSHNTRLGYLNYIERFFEFAQTNPEQIQADYDNMDEKKFKQKYTPLIIDFGAKVNYEKFSPSSVSKSINTPKSFFKYHSLPLNFIPSPKEYAIFHNRDIIKEEVEEIIKVAEPRERAFYVLMVQSGLRPNEICSLRIESLENLLDENPPVPNLIRIPQEDAKGKYSEYFTFCGKESIYYLKEYIKRRSNLTPEAYLFTKEDNETQIDTDLVSHVFRRTVVKLKKQNVLDFKNKKSAKANRNEIRLYNLRKYFRNHANAGADYVNFWMGHSLGVDDHYFSKTDVEQHRTKYKQFALPSLRIDARTPNQTDQTITELQDKLEMQRKELQEKKAEIENLKANLEQLKQSQTATDVKMNTFSTKIDFLLRQRQKEEKKKK